jgi:hypothetical protein
MILMLFVSVNLFAELRQVTPYNTDAQALISASQDLTNAWVDLGSVIEVKKASQITLFFDVDINDSQNFRFRLLKQVTKTGSDNVTVSIFYHTY